MTVPTIRSQRSINFSKVLGYLIGIAGIFGVGFFTSLAIKSPDFFNKKAAFNASVLYGKASVYIDSQLLGQTPYDSTDIKPGEHKVKLASDTRIYETTINFIPNKKDTVHQVGIQRDLGVSDIFSSGQDFWFESDKSNDVLRIVSDPAGATVFIDNNEVGKTPFSSDKLSEGEYDVRLDFSGYESQPARINIKKGYMLNINAKLFPMPIPIIKAFEDSNNLFDLSLSNTALTADTQDWALAVVYWNTTRGISIDGVGLNKEQLFDYFLDYKGNLYDKNGQAIAANTDEVQKLKDAKRGGYLGRMSDGAGLTQQAKDTLLAISGAIAGGKKATVLQTPTGWLRVRDAAGLNGVEVARINTGEEYSVIEQTTGWVKIKVSDSVSGWVSADYVSIT